MSTTRYTRYPQGMEQKMPLPPSLKNDIILTPNHESLHAKSNKQPFALVVDSRHRNAELYPNANNYVIQIPRYKDVLSVEITGADIPHSGFNVDGTCNKIYLVLTTDMYEQYLTGIRVNGTSYVEVTIPPGNYEAGDFASQITTDTSGTPYQFFYDFDAPVLYKANTGVLAMALALAVKNYSPTDASGVEFVTVFNYKTSKYTIISNLSFGLLNLDKDNFPPPTLVNGVFPPGPSDGYLGANSGHFDPLPNGMYAILGMELKNYFPANSTFFYANSPPTPTESGLIDGAFDPTNTTYVQVAQGKNYNFPVAATDLSSVLLFVNATNPKTRVAFALPNRVNFTGEKYIILDIPELNYRESTSVRNNQFFCRIILDTAINTPSLADYFNRSATENFFPTTQACVNTVKSIKASDIGNSKCIKYFAPSLGVLSKLTIRWLKHNGTPYDFQGQEHSLGFEIQTIAQSAAYFNTF